MLSSGVALLAPFRFVKDVPDIKISTSVLEGAQLYTILYDEYYYSRFEHRFDVRFIFGCM